MFIRRLFGLIAGAAALLTVPAALAQTPPARDWTIMVYMNGKNNLEPDALNNFHAMAGVGSTDKVAIVAELGRPAKHYTGAEGNWSGVYRFHIAKNARPRPQSAVEKVAAGVASDMGKPETLANFVGWAKVKYPAKRYMVIVWNHGQGYRLMFSRLMARVNAQEKALLPGGQDGRLGGYRAVSSDDDTGSILYNSEVQRAISKSFSGNDKLDVLGFDACLMGMLETAYALDGNARLMVASEDLEPGDGWQYADWLARVVANPSMSPEAVGRSIVDTYGSHYGNASYTTLSMVDLSRAKAAATALTRFSDALRGAGEGEMQLMRAARADLASFADWEPPSTYLSIDLATLLERYKTRTSNAALSASAGDAITAARSMVVAHYASTRYNGTPGDGYYGPQGVALYYPASADEYRRDPFHNGYVKSNQDRPVAFVRDEKWADLLYALLGIH